MRLKNLIVFSLFFFFSFLFIGFFSTVEAQQKSERWVCLVAAREGSHTASLSVNPGSKLLPNSPTYVFECLTNNLCSSGNSSVDMQVFGKNSYAEMASQFNYKLNSTTLPSNPITSDAGGMIAPFEWTSETLPAHARRWLALNYFAPTIDPALIGEAASQQLATLSFETVINSDCISLSWDPYGRVFDSASLEPIKGSAVTLLTQRQDGTFTKMTPADLLGGNILNPQITDEDGGFSFVVPDGAYKLTASSPNYTFPVSVDAINQGYGKIYTDIYPGATGEEIIQQGVIQHRDIPLRPIGVSSSSPVKLMEYFYDLDKPTSTIYVRGRASHPFATVTAYSLKTDPETQTTGRYRLLTENPVSSDQLGNFTIKIPQATFEPGEIFGEIEVQKADLSQQNLGQKIKKFLFGLLAGKVNAQEPVAAEVTRFEPILNYVEGYAYDEVGEVLPNSTVSVYLTFSNKPSYQTQTNEEGYYKITSEYLPSLPYRIVYNTPSGRTVPATTTKFIAMNSNTLAASDINVNQFKNEKGEIISENEELFDENNPENGQEGPVNVKSKLGNNLFMVVVVILLVLLIVIAVMLIRYFKKFKQE